MEQTDHRLGAAAQVAEDGLQSISLWTCLVLLRCRDTPQPAEKEEKPCDNIPEEVEEATATPALIQTSATMGTSVWGRLFLSRRVRPQSAGSRASAARSAAPR